MSIKILDSRRLTGPNLLSRHPGAIIDIEIKGYATDKVAKAWQEQAARLLKAVGWRDEEIFIRAFKDGLSLAFSAPVDALYAATEVNEAALERTTMLLAGKEPNDFEIAAKTLKKSIEREQNSLLLNIQSEAHKRGVCFLSDDDDVSVGLGTGSQTWPAKDLPDPETIEWRQRHNVPLALVTGTNGKSTTVRLLESILKAAGKTPGITSTDYIRVAGEIIDKGDYSGPGGARTLLRDRRVDTAILEVARGGILRRGLGVPNADVALITNVAEDHLNQYGIDSLEDLIAAKFVVQRTVEKDGVLVLNADDAGIVKHAQKLASRICWFSCDAQNPQLTKHLSHGGSGCFIRSGEILFSSAKEKFEPIVAVAEIPITMNSAARHNVSNSLAATAVAKKLGIPNKAIADGLKRFAGNPADNPGRGNYFDVKGARALVDFAHNVHGMTAIVDTVKAFPGRRRLILFGLAGDRTETEIRGLARAAWQLQPDRIIITEIPEYLRGAELGLVPGIIRDELKSLGAPDEILDHSDTSLEGVKKAVAWAQAGDFLLLLVHSQRDEAIRFLQEGPH